MKKNIYLLFSIICISFFAFTYNVCANYQAKVVNTTPCQLYKDLRGKNATGSCIYSNTKFNALTEGPYWVDVGDQLTVNTSKAGVKAPTSGYGSECKSEFVYISINYGNKSYNGYVCKENLWDGVVSDAMKKEFTAAGFPNSYHSSLALLKTAHPNWKFVAVNTKLNFNTVVDNEDSGNKSLIQWTSTTNDAGYLSTENPNYNWNTDVYKAYDGSTWFAANRNTIAYYIDPRNFLSDNYIFQFESLGYVANSNYSSIIKTLLKDQYISKFADVFVTAGQESKVNPVYLAALSKQEVGGSSATTAIKGGQFTYENKTYSGLYNFYNIGATSGTNAVYRGLVFANGTDKGVFNSSYNRPWNTTTKAIVGGANWIYDQYIKYGQNTSYFKKWNVVHASSLYGHQYMQNIQAPYKEAYSTYQAYYSLGLLNTNFTFFIPVYNNMPASTTLPKKGSPNNYLKALTVKLDNSSSNSLSGFNGSTTSYTINVGSNVQKATIAATKVNAHASITGTGTKNLVTGSNKITITVTAQNGNKKNYTLNIIKAASSGGVTHKPINQIIKGASINTDGNYINGLTFTTSIASMKNKIRSVDANANVTFKRSNKVINSGNLVTGDTLTIISGSENKTYTIILYGDLNSDGKISIVDLLKVQKHLLGTSKLTGAQLKAADVNKDGKITVVDLLKVQKHILGDSLISQK